MKLDLDLLDAISEAVGGLFWRDGTTMADVEAAQARLDALAPSVRPGSPEEAALLDAGEGLLMLGHALEAGTPGDQPVLRPPGAIGG